MRSKQIISEETLTTWITFSALSAIIFIVVANVFLYLLYGCWPLRNSHPGSVNCFSESLPSWIHLVPAILGSITGTYLTKLHMRRAADSSKK